MGLEFLSPPENGFEEIYLKVRKAENRLFSDETVRELPEIFPAHPLKKEWQQRKNSAEKLVEILKKDIESKSLLDVGCGNGWLSNYISQNTYLQVTGIDVNQTELEQAERVFPTGLNLKFYYGDIFKDIFPPESFDIVLLSSSIQYFSNLPSLLRQLKTYLKPDGYILISDSPLYTRDTFQQAREYSDEYYRNLGFPAMKDNYFHHLEEDIFKNFEAEYLFWPKSIINKLIPRKKIPFPIVLVR